MAADKIGWDGGNDESINILGHLDLFSHVLSSASVLYISCLNGRIGPSLSKVTWCTLSCQSSTHEMCISTGKLFVPRLARLLHGWPKDSEGLLCRAGCLEGLLYIRYSGQEFVHFRLVTSG